MTLINTVNRDWDIVSHLHGVLAAAQDGGGSATFSQTGILQRREFHGQQLKDSPAGIVLYKSTREADLGNNDNDQIAVVEAEILLAFRATADAAGTEAARVQEAIRLKNVALNAILADRTRGGKAGSFDTPSGFIDGTEADTAQIEHRIDPPWCSVSIPVRCAFRHTLTGR